MQAVGKPLRGHTECASFVYRGDKLRMVGADGVRRMYRHGPSGHYICSCGATYSGSWEMDKREGWGVWASFPCTYAGEWLDDLFHGRGSGDVRPGTDGRGVRHILSGTFKNGVLHGRGIVERLHSESTFNGSYVDGFRSGKGTLKAFQYTYVGQFTLDEPTGLGVKTWRDGRVDTGVFKNGSLYGKGKLVNGDGVTHIGHFCCGELNGPDGKIIDKDGKVTHSGTFNHGSLNGDDCMQDREGIVYRGGMQSGSYHGNGTMTTSRTTFVGRFSEGWRVSGVETHQDGGVYMGHYKLDRRCGQGTYTHPSGIKYEGQWDNDVSRGQGTYTDEGGTVTTGTFGPAFALVRSQCSIRYKDGSLFVGDTTLGDCEMRGPIGFRWTYKGAHRFRKFHGFGVWTMPCTGHTRCGFWSAGYLHGKAVVLNPTAKTSEFGPFVEGRRHGEFLVNFGKLETFKIRYDADVEVSREKVEFLSSVEMVLKVKGSAVESDSEHTCVCCREKPVTRVIVPCGHACVCDTCAAEVYNPMRASACPVCRGNIHCQPVRIFYP
jgi:hypothetical protein